MIARSSNTGKESISFLQTKSQRWTKRMAPYLRLQRHWSRSRNGIQPLPEEVSYASGKLPFDSSIHAEYIQKLDAQAAGIKEAFARQQARAAVCLVNPFYRNNFNCSNRNLGTRVSLRSSLSNGLLLVINHLTRWKNLSLLQ
jgi:hypothetical protein